MLLQIRLSRLFGCLEYRRYNVWEEQVMELYTDAIKNLPAADKLLLVEKIWGDLTSSEAEMPLSKDVLREAARRRDEMIANPDSGRSHDEIWTRINAWRNG